jgi:hypothetical protein
MIQSVRSEDCFAIFYQHREARRRQEHRSQ